MIKRESLLNKLIDYKDKDIIKIITGIRRCGKSYLLFNIYYEYLIESGVEKVIYGDRFKDKGIEIVKEDDDDDDIDGHINPKLLMRRY